MPLQQFENFPPDFGQVVLRMKIERGLFRLWQHGWHVFEIRVGEQIGAELDQICRQCRRIRHVQQTDCKIPAAPFRTDQHLAVAAEQHGVARFINKVVLQGVGALLMVVGYSRQGVFRRLSGHNFDDII